VVKTHAEYTGKDKRNKKIIQKKPEEEQRHSVSENVLPAFDSKTLSILRFQNHSVHATAAWLQTTLLSAYKERYYHPEPWWALQEESDAC
jgi:hypothetical protein